MSQRPRVLPSDQTEIELDYVQILRGVLRRRKKVVIGAFVLIALPLVVWAVYGQQPRFQSKATVQIKPSIAEMFPEARNLPVGPNLSVQMAVLKSRSLAQEVLEAVPQETLDELIKENMETDYLLAGSNAVRRLLGEPSVAISPQERAMSELRGARMKFVPLKRPDGRGPSGLVEISSISFRPRVAMDLVNAYIQVLVNWSRRSEQEDVTATQKFLELQLTRVERDLAEAEAARAKFEERHGVVRLNERTQYEVSRLVQLEGQLSQVQSNREVARSRLKALQGALQKSPENPLVSSDAQVTAEAAESISARLVQLEATLVQMRAKYTDEHPSVIAAREEIKNLRSQLAQVPISDTPGARVGDTRMSRDEILRSIPTVKVDLRKLGTEEQSLRLQIDQLRQSLEKLTGRESDYSRLQRSVTSNRALASFLADKLFALQIREQSYGDVVKVIDPPILPISPVGAVSPRKLLFLIVFAFGTAGGLGVLIEYIYEPVESEKTIRRQVELPFLGSALAVPARRPKGDARPLVVFNEARKAEMPQEFYRTIRTNLEAANLRTPFKAIMITSPFPGEGKSTIVINLAVTLRELGRRVVLVDADLRNPGLSKVLQANRQAGLSKILQGGQAVARPALPIDVSIEAMGGQPGSDFLFIPSGDPPEDPAALLGSTRARELVAGLKKQWDYLIFDSPPVLLVSDNLLFATALDGVILVAHAGQTKKRDLQRAKNLLEEAGARVLGVILNQVPPSQIPYYYHRYSSYYQPYAPRQGKKRVKG